MLESRKVVFNKERQPSNRPDRKIQLNNECKPALKGIIAIRNSRMLQQHKNHQRLDLIIPIHPLHCSIDLRSSNQPTSSPIHHIPAADECMRRRVNASYQSHNHLLNFTQLPVSSRIQECQYSIGRLSAY